MDTIRRSLVKSISWRVLATCITVVVSYVITGSVKIATGIGIADMFIKLVVFYFHERAWNKIAFGRHQPPEYEI